MEAIKQTIAAIEAESLRELREALSEARHALAQLEDAKLAEMAAELANERSKIAYGPDGPAETAAPMAIPKQRRAIKDYPQA